VRCARQGGRGSAVGGNLAPDNASLDGAAVSEQHPGRVRAVKASPSRLGFERFAQRRITRRLIGDGQEVAGALVAEVELALVIRAPQIVGAGACPSEKPVPVARRRLTGRWTSPCRSKTAWMVLTAGTRTSCASRRTKSSLVVG